MMLVRRTLLTILGLSIIAGIWMMFRITWPFITFDYNVGFLLTKQSILHIDIWRWSFYIHIFTSIFVLIFGLIQFIRPILRKAPAFHRALGKAYILITLICSAPTGLIMGYYANGGIAAKASFMILSVLWWIFTFNAYREIRKGNVEKHIAFMTRSYALTLSALALRTYALFLPLVIHLPAKDMYALIAWLSWVPNLLLAEWFIRKKIFVR